MQNDVFGIMSAASKVFQSDLIGASRVIKYLKQRGISGKTAALFGLGFSNTDLIKFFENEQDSVLNDTGLFVEKYGKRYPRFFGRLMFPIRNIDGQICGFGGRVLADSEQPKYLNSPETPIFKKGHLLYGLHETKDAIKHAKRALVFEGYMDVISVHQAGIQNVVGSMGTACTSQQLEALFAHTNHITFCFDGDSAGVRAARSVLETVLPFINDKRVVDFVMLPAGEDPDSFIRSSGSKAFDSLLNSALPVDQYLKTIISGNADTGTMEGRSMVLGRLRKYWSTLDAAHELAESMLDYICFLFEIQRSEALKLLEM